MTWTVRGSRTVLRDRWINVRADDCVTPDGVEISPYYVLDYPDFVHAVALTPRSEVVLVRQYRHGAGLVSLELPGGLLDAADPDPVGGALRELKEETGYRGERARLVASLTVDPAKMANRLHLVVVEDVQFAGAAPEPTEAIEVVLLPIAEAVRLALGSGIVNAAQVGLLLTGLHAAGRLRVEST